MGETPTPEVMTVAAIEQRYPDEWVALEITRDHKHPAKVRGRLIAHGPSPDDIHEPHLRFRAAHPEARTLQFFTGDVVAPGVVAVL
jgi:hypothetical protein